MGPRLAPALAAALLTACASGRPVPVSPTTAHEPPPPWDGPPLSAEPKALLAAAAALPPPAGASVDLLLEEGRFVLDGRGAATFTHRLVFRPLTPEAARRWGRIERGFAPWHQATPEVRARVVAPDGTVHDLDPAALVERGASEGEGIPSARRVLSGTLPGVVPGALVEELVTVRDRAPLFEGGVVQRHALAQPAPLRLGRVTIEAPEELPLRWRVRGAELRPAERVLSGVRTVSLERRDVAAALPPEPDGPRDAPPVPELQFGWGRSWSEVAARYGALAEAARDAAPLPEAARAAVRGATGPAAEARALAWVRAHLRATGVALGDADVAPAPPGETVARGRGDCKDLALVLAALLRETGEDARVALLRTGWLELAPELPGLGPQDHAVVRVEGRADGWLDPCDRFAPAGTVDPLAQGRLALVTGPGVPGLERTPAPGPEANAAETVRMLSLAELGPGRVAEARTLRGDLAAAERSFRAGGPGDARGDLELSRTRDVLRADVLVAAEVEGLDDLAAPLAIRIEADRSDVVETQDDGAEIPLPPDLVFEPLPAALREEGAPLAPRASDVELALPYRWSLTYRVVPPDGFRPRPPLPAGGVETFGPARLEQAFALGPDGAITATTRFDTGARRIPATAAAALARRVRELVRQPPVAAFERTGAALLAAGRIPEALAEVRRLAARHPGEALHRLHLALALLEAGLADEAAAEARRAIALEPRRAWAHRVLAYALEHDAVGRFHGPGFDRAGAVAAYEAARALDPEHAGGRAALAELLAHDDAGVRHGPGADLPRAIAEYAAIGAELGVHDFDGGLLAALFAAGRHAEAARLGRILPPGPERNALLVAATAASEGAARAEQTADALEQHPRGDPPRRASPPEGERSKGGAPYQALSDGATLLLRERLHPLAAALAAAAARRAPGDPGAAARAEALAVVRRHEDLVREGDEVDRLVRALLVAGVRGDAGLAVAAAAPRLAAAGAGPVLAAGLPFPPEGARLALRETGLPPDVLLDLVLSRATAAREGDLAGGLRVRLAFPFAPRAPVAIHLAAEDGAVRLVATDAAWPLLGAEAARRAAAGDAAGAARFLGWAREAVPGALADPESPAGLLAALCPGAAADGEAARRAGLALAAHGDPRGATAPELRALLAAAEGPLPRRALRVALVAALRGAGDAAGTLEAAEALLAEVPRSRAGFAAKAWALRRLRRPAALAPAAAAFLAAAPDDPDALALAGTSLLLAGDLDGAARTFRRAIEGGAASPLVYNDAAWLALLAQPPGPLALEWARRGAGKGDLAAENTLAAALAEAGRPAEARAALLRSLDDGRPLSGADRYVHGRIAEALGELAAARDLYARVEPERRGDEDDPADAALLARRRLAALRGTPARTIVGP